MILRLMRSGAATILIVGAALVACGNGPIASSLPPVAFFGPCFQEPNYIGQVPLNRWRSFPLAYFFDDAGFSPDLLASYRGAITSGLHRWSDATGTELGTVVEVESRDQADLVISYRHVPNAGTIARAFHSTGTPFLAGGEIAFNSSELTGIEERVREGEIDRDVFFDVIAGVTAHEMGHILGIIGHSNRDDVLMGTAFHEAPVPADVNTLIHAYCRDS